MNRYGLSIVGCVMFSTGLASAQLVGRFAKLPGYDVRTQPVPFPKFAVADFDGDGQQDVFIGTLANRAVPRNRLLIGDGNGRFLDESVKRLPAFGDNVAQVLLGDVDGDHDQDIVLLESPQRANTRHRLLLNDGRGGFTDAPAGQFPIAARGGSGLLHDLDGDGDLDLLLLDAMTIFGSPRIYWNNGKGAFSNQPGPFPKVIAVRFARAGDVNGDGHVDVLTGGQFGCRLFTGDGKGKFTNATAWLPSATTFSHDGWFLDLDGDQDLDIVLAVDRVVSGSDRVWLNDGKGRFRNAGSRFPLPTGSGQTMSFVPSDTDLDGDVDLIVFQLGQPPQLQENVGGRAFRAVRNAFPGTRLANGAGIAVDSDHDGDPDLIFVTQALHFASPVDQYVNRHRQIHGESPPFVGQSHLVRIAALPGYATRVQAAVLLVALRAANRRIPIPPYGCLGLDPAALVTIPAVLIAAPIGEARVTLPIPADNRLRLKTLYTQGLIAHGPTLASWRLTNANAELIR